MFKKNIEYLYDNFDKNISIICIFMSLLLIIFLLVTGFKIIFVIISLLVLFSCTFYFLIHNKNNLNINIVYESKRIFIILFILFFIFLNCLIISLYFRPYLYKMPLTYFIILPLMAGAISVEILFLPKKQLYYGIILSEIIIIGLSITYLQSLIFPSVVGIDPWAHQMFTNSIVKTGRILNISQYSQLPLFHLEIASASLFYNLNYKMSVLLSSDLFLIIINVLFIFLLGRYFFSEKIGLFASLFLIIANHQIYMLIYTIPNSIAAIFIIPIIYLIFKFYNKKGSIIITVIILLFMMSIILTHAIVSMALAIILLVGWLSFYFYKNIYKNEIKNYIPIYITIFFIVIMFSWWTYVSGSLIQFSILLGRGFLASKIILPLAVSISFTEEFFNQIGMFLFFSISLIGIFYMISNKFGNAKKFIFATMGFIILLTAFIPILTGQTIIQHRWYYFAQILLAIPLALAIMIFLNLIKKVHSKMIFLFIFSIFITFFMITSPAALVYNPIFSTNNDVRYGLYESEITAASFFSKKTTSNLYSDFDYFSNPSSSVPENFFNVSNSRIKFLDIYFENRNYNTINGIIVIRDEITKNPFDSGEIVIKLNYNIYKLLDSQYFSKIYTCNSVNGYIK